MKGDWSAGISDLLWTQAGQKGRACRPNQASGLLKERKLDRTLQGICWDSSKETTSNSTSGLMYLDGMLLRFLDARAWTFSTDTTILLFQTLETSCKRRDLTWTKSW